MSVPELEMPHLLVMGKLLDLFKPVPLSAKGGDNGVYLLRPRVAIRVQRNTA